MTETNEDAPSEEPVEVETTDEKQPDSETGDELAKAQQKIISLKKEMKGLKKSPEEKAEVKPKAKPSTTNELDFGQLAFHNSKTDSLKIESEEDTEFLKETIKETGKSQEAILKSTWFNAELKEAQEKRETADTNKKATPSNTKRSVPKGKDNIDYWVKQDFAKVPKHLRGEVLKKKVANENSPFDFE